MGLLSIVCTAVVRLEHVVFIRNKLIINVMIGCYGIRVRLIHSKQITKARNKFIKSGGALHSRDWRQSISCFNMFWLHGTTEHNNWQPRTSGHGSDFLQAFHTVFTSILISKKRISGICPACSVAINSSPLKAESFSRYIAVLRLHNKKIVGMIMIQANYFNQ